MPIGIVSQGTKENFQVIITDREESVTTLATAGPKFDVMDSTDAFKYGDGTYAGASAASAVLMVISCLVDTAFGGIWTEGEYRLFVWFTVGSEVVRKGPFFFDVVE
jgi:uncharacterized membrane protein YdfJ with MMPL/SSD domain